MLCLGAMAVLQTHCEDDMPMEDGEEDIEQDALSSEQMRGMHGKIDTNRDGKVSLSEIMSFSDEMRRLLAAKDISTVLEEMDGDKDGKLSLEEMRKDMDQWGEGEEDKKERDERMELETRKFRTADMNQDGFLDKAELPSLFYPETHEGVLEITAMSTLKQKDTNGDGKLTAKEFWEGDVADTDEDLQVSEEEQADFRKLDKNKDGLMDLQELKAWESGYFHTEEAMMKLFELADKDSDMHVTADELDAAREQIAGSDAQYHLMEWAEHHEL